MTLHRLRGSSVLWRWTENHSFRLHGIVPGRGRPSIRDTARSISTWTRDTNRAGLEGLKVSTPCGAVAEEKGASYRGSGAMDGVSGARRVKSVDVAVFCAFGCH